MEDNPYFTKYIEASAKDNINVEGVFNQMIQEAYTRSRTR